jgi:hypothetical protein
VAGSAHWVCWLRPEKCGVCAYRAKATATTVVLEILWWGCDNREFGNAPPGEVGTAPTVGWEMRSTCGRVLWKCVGRCPPEGWEECKRGVGVSTHQGCGWVGTEPTVRVGTTPTESWGNWPPGGWERAHPVEVAVAAVAAGPTAGEGAISTGRMSVVLTEGGDRAHRGVGPLTT